MLSKTQFFILHLVVFGILGLMYQCSPASDPRYQECMREMKDRGAYPQDAMSICNHGLP